VVPDLDSYQAGRAEGLLEFCVADNGYRLGSSGRGFSPVCPSHLEADFRAAYDRGREIYLARSAVKTTRARINKHQQALHDLEDDKGNKLAELIADGLKAEQRVLILYEITELEQEMHSVEDEIAALEYDLSSQQAHLDSLTQHASR
jgi:chromosome segregation ATPase